MNNRYSKEFKLHVINTYLESLHGIRVIARSFDLPTKNYITKLPVKIKSGFMMWYS